MAIQDSHFDPTAEPFDWDAVARYLAGESPPDEARAVRAWLDARPDRAELVAALARSLDRLAAVDVADVDVEGALAKVHARIDEPALVVERGSVPRFAPRVAVAAPRWRRSAGWLAAAAAVAIVAVGVARLRPHGATGPALAPRQLAFRTGVGARDSVRLPDGTRVLLGPGSRLDVAADYGGVGRDVILTGEAYFDVVHDARAPFVVHVVAARIEDIGTAFTIQSDTTSRVSLAVTAGRVRLTRSGRERIVLSAGQTVSFDSATPAVRVEATHGDETAWTRGQLVFREAPLSRVAADVERWYGLRLRVDDSALARRRLTATFEKETPQEVMAVIGAALGTPVTRQGELWVVGRPARGRATGIR